MTRTRRFTMHPQLLFSVIERQAGTLSKAVLEGVMNAVDAKATRLDITINCKAVHIKDDGIGFRSREEIEQFFETFGQPHSETEHKVYAQFRMGRGQMFAFGRNLWETGEFRMDVDIKRRGLDYVLHEGKSVVKGCDIRITLYEEQLPSELASTLHDLERWCKWVSIPVRLNGKRISKDPTKEKWDHILPEAFIRLRENGSVHVYNLGVHVCELSGYKFGCGGEVVSRRQLKVNFARNDIQSDCPVWKQIKPFLNRQATKENKRRTTLTDDQRQRLAEQFRLGELDEGSSLKLFTDVAGRHWSLDHMNGFFHWDGKPVITNAERGHRIGDKLHQQRLAFVLANETLQRFECAGVQELLALVHKRVRYSLREWKYQSFKTLSASMNLKYALVPKEDYTALEEAMLRTIIYAQGSLLFRHREADDKDRRRLVLGESEHADGWTDGTTFIAVNREFLKRVGTGVEAFVEIGLLLLHEYCHDGPDTATHIHGPDFYQAYHDGSRDALAAFSKSAVERYPTVLEALGRRTTKRHLRQHDKLARSLKGVNALAAREETR